MVACPLNETNFSRDKGSVSQPVSGGGKKRQKGPKEVILDQRRKTFSTSKFERFESWT